MIAVLAETQRQFDEWLRENSLTRNDARRITTVDQCYGIEFSQIVRLRGAYRIKDIGQIENRLLIQMRLVLVSSAETDFYVELLKAMLRYVGGLTREALRHVRGTPEFARVANEIAEVAGSYAYIKEIYNLNFR